MAVKNNMEYFFFILKIKGRTSQPFSNPTANEIFTDTE